MKFNLSQRGSKKSLIPTYEDLSRIDRDLDFISNIQKNCLVNLYVVGGVGIGLVNGNFYRQNHDLDIGIFISNLPIFFEYIKSSNLQIYYRSFMTHISKRSDFIVLDDVNNLEFMIQKRKHLKIFNPNCKTYIDLFLYDRCENIIKVLSEDIFIESSDFFPISKCIYNNKTFLVPNLEHIRLIKEKKEIEKNLDDNMKILQLQLCN